MKLVAMETHHLQAGLPLIHSFIHVTWAVLIRALQSVLWTRLRGSLQQHQTSASCLSALARLCRQTGSTQLWSQQRQCATLHVSGQSPVRMLLCPLVTVRPRTASLSFHWLLSSAVMPCDSGRAFALHQSASLYPGGWSLEIYLNPMKDS